jgi:hypothetical protein
LRRQNWTSRQAVPDEVARSTLPTPAPRVSARSTARSADSTASRASTAVLRVRRGSPRSISCVESRLPNRYQVAAESTFDSAHIAHPHDENPHMAQTATTANQRTILKNQASILKNQKTILGELKAIRANQATILKNQKLILAK